LDISPVNNKLNPESNSKDKKETFVSPPTAKLNVLNGPALQNNSSQMGSKTQNKCDSDMEIDMEQQPSPSNFSHASSSVKFSDFEFLK
jgi:hypothetical protein